MNTKCALIFRVKELNNTSFEVIFPTLKVGFNTTKVFVADFQALTNTKSDLKRVALHFYYKDTTFFHKIQI